MPLDLPVAIFNLIHYDSNDIQDVADSLGYNRLSEIRLRRIRDNICWRDEIFDYIDEAIREAVQNEMERPMPEEPNGQ